MTTPLRIAILGAGINGVATALWLARAGHRPILIDPAEPGRAASYGNAGVLAAAAVLPVAEPGIWWRAPRMALNPDAPLFLRWRYLPRLLPWLARLARHTNNAEVDRIAAALGPLLGDALDEHLSLAAGTDAAHYVKPVDYLYAFRDRAAFDAGAAGWARRKAAGHRWTTLEGDALRDAEPGLGPEIGFGAALHGHGMITDPGAYLAALTDAAQAVGATHIRAKAQGLRRQAGSVTGVHVGGDMVDCDHVVITAGAWSASLMADLGLTVPLESERGYHLDLFGSSIRPRGPTYVSTGAFVATPMEGRVRLAGVLEFGGLNAGPSKAPFALLRRQVRRAFPGLTWQHEEEWMGHRPALPDSLPVIGAVPGVANAWAGFGHQHVGLTAGARTGRMLAQLITGTRPNIDISAFAPDRFA